MLADAAATLLADFGASLRRDLAVVQAACDLPWATSPAEGQINRLKMLKRTMYGVLASRCFVPAYFTPHDAATAARKVRENPTLSS